VADRVTYKLGVTMHRCRYGKAPPYLVDCCTPVTDVVGRQRLRSATQQLMVVPRHRLSTVGRRAFTVHGPMVWNSLPDDLRARQGNESFRQGLKIWLFSRYYRAQRIRDLVIITLYKSTLYLSLPDLTSVCRRQLWSGAYDKLLFVSFF